MLPICKLLLACSASGVADMLADCLYLLRCWNLYPTWNTGNTPIEQISSLRESAFLSSPSVAVEKELG